MSNKDAVILICTGVLVGMVLTGVILANTPSYHARAKQATEECQATLPRDQYCKIVAVPEGVEE